MDALDGKEKKKDKDLKRLQELAQDNGKMQERKKQYKQLHRQLKKSPDVQLSTVDPDSRALVIKTDVVEVAYNTQVATDDKHSLIVHYEVINKMDRKALHPTALSAKENMGLGKEDKLIALADKGYFNAEQLDACRRDHIITYVPRQGNQQHCGIPAKGYRRRRLPLSCENRYVHLSGRTHVNDQ